MSNCSTRNQYLEYAMNVIAGLPATKPGSSLDCYLLARKMSRILAGKGPIQTSNFITDGFPEASGGGASAATEAAPGAEGGSGGDDDDGGDADPEPRRPSPPARPARPSASSGKRRDATATAGDLALPPKESSIELWRLPTVLQYVPISRSGWWAGVKAGRYPSPVRLSTRCVAWRSSDIRSLIASL